MRRGSGRRIWERRRTRRGRRSTESRCSICLITVSQVSNNRKRPRPTLAFHPRERPRLPFDADPKVPSCHQISLAISYTSSRTSKPSRSLITGSPASPRGSRSSRPFVDSRRTTTRSFPPPVTTRLGLGRVERRSGRGRGRERRMTVAMACAPMLARCISSWRLRFAGPLRESQERNCCARCTAAVAILQLAPPPQQEGCLSRRRRRCGRSFRSRSNSRRLTSSLLPRKGKPAPSTTPYP